MTLYGAIEAVVTNKAGHLKNKEVITDGSDTDDQSEATYVEPRILRFPHRPAPSVSSSYLPDILSFS